MTTLGKFGIDTRKDRGDMLVGFAVRTNLEIMNTYPYCKPSKIIETKNEIYFIPANKLNTAKNMAVLNT